MKKKVELISSIIVAIALVAVGVLTIVFYNDESFHDALGYIFGSLLLVLGLFRLLLSLLDRRLVSEFMLGVIFISLGGVVLYQPNILVDSLPIFFATGFIAVGLLFLVQGIIPLVLKKKEKLALPILYIIFGSILVIGGILIVVFHNQAKSVITLLAGVAVVLIGLSVIVQLILKNRRNAPKSETIVVEGEVKESKHHETSEKVEPGVEEVTIEEVEDKEENTEE